jgi:hypothetical protein
MPPARSVAEGGLLHAARTWVDMGFAILPVRGGGKDADPNALGGKGYKVSDAGIVHPERVNRIWSVAPGMNVGVVCGAPSRILVIDGDKNLKKNKHADPMGHLLKWQEEKGVEIPAGPMVETPSGGFHIYLRLPDDIGHVPSPSGWLKDVDIRCDGTYVVAPPSYRQVEAADSDDLGWTEEDSVQWASDGAGGWVKQTPTVWKEYAFLDLDGSPYSPTPDEFLAELDEAIAPLDLIEDIRTNRSIRTKNNASGGAPRGSTGHANGLTGVQWYRDNGIPEDAKQWDVLYYDVAWPMLNAGWEREVTVAVMREIVDHPDTPIDSWDPWLTGRPEDGTDSMNARNGQSLWAITNRAYTRAETMDGDEFHQRKTAKQFEEKYGNVISWLSRSADNNDEKGTGK